MMRTMGPGLCCRCLLIPKPSRRSRMQSQTNPLLLTALESSRSDKTGQNKPTTYKRSFFSRLQRKTGPKSRQMSRRAASLFRNRTKESGREADMLFRINRHASSCDFATPDSGTGEKDFAGIGEEQDNLVRGRDWRDIQPLPREGNGMLDAQVYDSCANLDAPREEEESIEFDIALYALYHDKREVYSATNRRTLRCR